jgi:hypothetical protein
VEIADGSKPDQFQIDSQAEEEDGWWYRWVKTKIEQIGNFFGN